MKYKIARTPRHQVISSFLAIVPPKEIQAQIRDIKRSLHSEIRNFNFVPLERVHIIIKFLGVGVAHESLNLIQDLLENIKNKRQIFDLNLVQLKFGLPYQNIPRVLFIDVEPNKILEKLCTDLHYSIKSMGLTDIVKEKDFYRNISHLTIAKVKHNVSRSFGRKINKLLKNLVFHQINFTVDRIFLIKSSFSNKKPQDISYEIIKEFTFS